MALPSVGAAPRYLEEIRIGGGYGSTPDGGVDIDKAGNVAADGDLTVDGTVDVKGGTIQNSIGTLEVDSDFKMGSSGVDKTWSAYFGAAEVFNIDAGTLINHTFQAGDVNVPLVPFDQTAQESVSCAVGLPADYDGSALTFTIYWTSRAGTTGTAKWSVNASVFENAESLAQTNSAIILDDTFIAQNDTHVVSASGTPDGASTGCLLTLFIRRQANLDTLDDDADLIGIRISYT